MDNDDEFSSSFFLSIDLAHPIELDSIIQNGIILLKGKRFLNIYRGAYAIRIRRHTYVQIHAKVERR